MIQLEVSLNHVTKVYSREPIGNTHKLQVIDKSNGGITDATINSVTYQNGVVEIDFDYQTKEAAQYYLVFSSLDGTYKERFKSLAFATDTTNKTPYQNIEVNNNIS